MELILLDVIVLPLKIASTKISCVQLELDRPVVLLVDV